MRRSVTYACRGAAVGLLWSVFQLLLETWQSANGPIGRLLEAFSRIVPLRAQNWALGTAEVWTKGIALVMVLAACAAIAGLVAAVAARAAASRAWVVVGFAGAVTLWQGLSGATLSSIGSALASGALLLAGLLVATEPFDTAFSPGRRRLLRGALGAALLAAVAVTGRYVVALRERSRAPAAVDERGLPPALTPIGDFYVVSKNFSDPEVSLNDWRLRVDGRVKRRLELDMGALRARSAIRQIVTLECISNEIWGPYISTGEWIGVPLRELLLEAEPQEPVVDVVFHAADGYSDSIPLAVALEPAVLLAYGLNGETLPREHGFPLRLVVPGIYGMKNVKWITAVELSPVDYQGFWQQRGWSDLAVVQIHSRIDVPRGGASVQVGRDVFVGGIAFAGDRGIARVELSTDGGRHWQEVEQEAPLSPYSWVRWWTVWQPPEPGRYQLVVRAWDGRGNLQDGEDRAALPNGATGWHRVTVEARTPE
ncbi:MAG: molybdopterin-dependent oxidoreductase [Thermomicrobium sp.]|nr:molybdopterin-dependent oxidoreductase [Thermomicrobium sp.]MDW8058588.1 molybdopterin-dependent oxidoreductase [Thermomicrobium sp.]